jgi:hypothetical protein
MTKSIHIRRWGLFMLFAGLLFALQEWLKLPNWLSTALFVVGWWFIVRSSSETSPGQKGSWWRPVVEILIMSVVVLGVAVGLSLWLGESFSLQANYTIALVFGVLGLLLLIGSLLFRGKVASGEEKPNLT